MAPRRGLTTHTARTRAEAWASVLSLEKQSGIRQLCCQYTRVGRDLGAGPNLLEAARIVAMVNLVGADALSSALNGHEPDRPRYPRFRPRRASRETGRGAALRRAKRPPPRDRRGPTLGGLHYHFSGVAGVVLGRNVAKYDLRHAFRPAHY